MDIYIFDEIASPLARQVAETLCAKPREAVQVHLNSYGGLASEAFAIYNALKSHGTPVTILVEGVAFSAATLVACAGRCVAFETAVFGFHSPWSEVAGSADKLRDAANSLDKFEESAALIYSQKTGRPIDQMKAFMAQGETWMSAQEAKDAGFVDEIVPSQAVMRLPPNIQLPTRFAMPTTQPPVMLSADDVVKMCADEPGLITEMLSKPRTKEEVAARMADAKLIRQMAEAAHQSGPAIDAMVMAGVHPDTAGQQMVRMLAEQDAAIRIDSLIPYGGNRHFLDAASDALSARMGVVPKNAHPAARDFQDSSLTGMAAMCLSATGRNTVGMSRSQLVKMAMTSSDFPSLLSTTANKSLTNRFEALAEYHRQLCDTADLPDFKTASAVNVSFLPGLERKDEGGEIKYGALTDSSENYKLLTYAKGLTLSREAMINDDLQAFSTLIASAANASARLERDLVFGVLTGNAAMSDGVALFHANHGNLDTSSAGVDVAGLSKARVLMRKQKDVNGGYVLTAPRFIVCPVAEEGNAEALTASLTYRPSSNIEIQTPDWVKGLMVLADPRLDAVDAGNWYLLSDPTTAPTIRLGYLNGQTVPVVEESNDFDTDVMKFKIRFDVACAAIGWAGAVLMS